MNQKILVIAYGNRDRQDDGAGWHILAKTTRRLGLVPPENPGDWVESVDGKTRWLYLYQLLPEMAEDLTAYQRVIFIDAHNSPELPDVIFKPVLPVWEQSGFTHHMSAEGFLSIAQTLFGTYPQANMLSVRGFSFEFEHELSHKTAVLVDQAVALLESELNLGKMPEIEPPLEGELPGS